MAVSTMKFPAERVVELEAELKEVRAAFEEYITSSKELEAGLDKELSDLHEKLESSTAANSMLENQLQRMEPMLSELERSLEVNKTRVKEETRLRQQAEKARMEIESRYQESEAIMTNIRQENESLRDECEALREELEYRCQEIEKFQNSEKQREIHSVETSQHTRSGKSFRTFDTNGVSTVDDSYAEILDELEGVTEQLIETQQKLWKAEDNLRESQSRVQMLERSVKHLEREAERKAQSALLDLADDETSNATVNGAEQKLSAELERVKKQLADAQNELKAAEEQAKNAQEQAKVAEDNAKNIEGRGPLKSVTKNDLDDLRRRISEKEQELDKSKEENTLLAEEIACLRDILQEQAEKEQKDAQNNAEVRSKEINALREKLKVIVKENAVLKEQVSRLENGLPASRTDDVVRLKKEIAQLRVALEKANGEKNSILEDSEVEWHLKLEKLREELEEEKDHDLAELREQLIEEKKVAVKSLEERVEKLADEKYELEDKVEHLEGEVRRYKKETAKFATQTTSAAENLKVSRDEIVALKKKSGVLSTDLEHAKRNLARVESEAKEARDQYADVCAELEVARQILDEAGLDGETIAREDERELKRQIHALSKALEQLRQDYAELENDFLDSQHRFCDSQEDASRKTADEMDYLTGKIAEMEAALEAARTDYSEMSVKLEQARKESHESVKKGEKQGRESTMRAFKSEKIHDVRACDSEELLELDHLRLQLGDLTATLDKVHEELRDCKAQLESSEKLNLQLKQEIADLEKSKNESVHVLDKFFHGKSDVNLRGAPDPEPTTENEGIEIVRTPSKEGIFPFSWFTRDPPTDNTEVVGSETFGVNAQTTSSGEIHLRLLQVTRENEFLKEKLLNLGPSTEKELSSRASSIVEASEIKGMIIELEEALKANEKTSDELDRLSQKLAMMEKNLASTRKALEESNDENQDLRSEVRALKEALSETREDLDHSRTAIKTAEKENMITAEISKDFEELRDQLRTIMEEKATLQHQLDDSKIALSVSQYAQERNKEELRASEAKLVSSSDEIFRLKHELSSMSRSLSDVKQAYDDVRDQLRLAKSGSEDDAIKSVGTLSKQLKQLSEENNSLQQMVTELEEALELAQKEIEKKSKQVNSLHDSLVSTQQETRLLTDEITNLTTAFEESKTEYNSVVEELEAVCELFEEAREEAERNGKEAAIREIRTEMKGNREKERQALREQARKIFEENGALQRKLGEVEHALAEARTLQKNSEGIVAMKREILILKEALMVSEEEVRVLKEKEFNLNITLKESKNELRHLRDELELLSQASDDSRRAAERTARASAVEEFRSLDSNEELKGIREKLKKMLEESEQDVNNLGSAESERGRRAESLRLKMELLDMSMSFEKIMKENAVIEEELEYVRRTAEEARKEGEKDGKLKATKELRKEMREQREREMKDFKDMFNDVVEQNSSLSKQLREAEIKLSLAITAKEQTDEEVNRLQKDLQSAKAEIVKFQKHVSELTAEIETVQENHARSTKELTSSPSDESETKAKELITRLTALTIENTRLQSKLKNAESLLGSARSSEERRMHDMESLLGSLQESQTLIDDLEDQVAHLTKELSDLKFNNKELSHEKAELELKLKNADLSLRQAKSITSKDVDEVTKTLNLSKEENSKLKSQVLQLKQTLEDSTMELDQLREQFDRVCRDVATRDDNESNALRIQLKQLAEEKAVLQKQVDESRISLSLQKYSQDKSIEELKMYQERLQSSKEVSSAKQYDLSKVYDELTKTKEEVKEAMKVMRQINQILDSVDGIRQTGSVEDDQLSQRAEQLKAKVTEIKALLDKTRREQSMTEEKMEKLSAENKIAEKKAASTEAALEKVRQTQLKDRMELELCELKYNEAKKEASGYQLEVSRLKSALDFTQRDHTSLRAQLEHMNLRVAQMCMDAEARGKAAATEAIRSGANKVDESDRKELMAQFKRFYEENLSLQSKLVKMEAELAVVKEAEDKQKTIIETLERGAKETTSKAERLEAANKRLTQELDSLREDLDCAKKNRSAVVNELEVVKERLTEIMAAKAKETGVALGPGTVSSTISERDAEIRLLQEQLKKLSKKSVTLGKKVEEAECAVSNMRVKQEKTRTETESRKKQARDLQGQVQKAIEVSSRRDQEIGDFSKTMGSRVSKVEDNVSLLEKEISIAKGKLQVSEAGFFTARKRPGKTKPSFQSDQAVVTPSEKRETGTIDEDSSIHSAEDQINSESRQDNNGNGTNISREGPPPPQQIALKETNLTSRALEAIALSKKKNTLRKFDVRAAQSKIFGASNELFGKTTTEVVPASESFGRE